MIPAVIITYHLDSSRIVQNRFPTTSEYSKLVEATTRYFDETFRSTYLEQQEKEEDAEQPKKRPGRPRTVDAATRPPSPTPEFPKTELEFFYVLNPYQVEYQFETTFAADAVEQQQAIPSPDKMIEMANSILIESEDYPNRLKEALDDDNLFSKVIDVFLPNHANDGSSGGTASVNSSEKQQGDDSPASNWFVPFIITISVVVVILSIVVVILRRNEFNLKRIGIRRNFMPVKEDEGKQSIGGDVHPCEVEIKSASTVTDMNDDTKLTAEKTLLMSTVDNDEEDDFDDPRLDDDFCNGINITRDEEEHKPVTQEDDQQRAMMTTTIHNSDEKEEYNDPPLEDLSLENPSLGNPPLESVTFSTEEEKPQEAASQLSEYSDSDGDDSNSCSGSSNNSRNSVQKSKEDDENDGVEEVVEGPMVVTSKTRVVPDWSDEVDI